MILKKTTRNNGYGCSCCSQTWDDSEWIDEMQLPSLEEVVDEALASEPFSQFGDTIYCAYERNGKMIYGYELDVRKREYTLYVLHGEKRVLYDDWKKNTP